MKPRTIPERRLAGIGVFRTRLYTCCIQLRYGHRRWRKAHTSHTILLLQQGN
jgi:hypothetical protein